MKSILTDKN